MQLRITKGIGTVIALVLLLGPLSSSAQGLIDFSHKDRDTQGAQVRDVAQDVRATDNTKTKSTFSIFNRLRPQQNTQDTKNVEESDATDTTDVKPSVFRRVQNAVRGIKSTGADSSRQEVRGTDSDASQDRRRDAVIQKADLEENTDVRRAELQEKQSGRAETRSAQQEVRRAEQEDRRAERDEQLKERRETAIKAYFERMFRRLEAATNRLSLLADRVESRITKLQERGVDVSEANIKLGEARDAIADAKTTIQNLRASIPEILEGTFLFSEVKRQVRDDAIQAIRRAHKALVDAIVVLKANVRVELETNQE